MELSEYLSIIYRRFWTIVLVAVVVAVLTALLSFRQKESFEGSMTLTVGKQKPASQSGASFYQYDNYYLLQSSALFAEELSSWIAQPESVAKIYQAAGQALPEGGIKDYSRLIKAKKPQMNAPLIAVSISGGSREGLERILEEVKTVSQEKVASANQTMEEKFVLEASTPQILTIKPDPTVKTVAGILAGLVLGIVVAFGKEYFARNPIKK